MIMNKKTFAVSAISIAAALFVTSCMTTQVRQATVQELIVQGRYDEAKELFKTKTNINETDSDGNTALHIAAAVNEADLISFLIIKGADPEIKNRDGDTPIHIAIKNDCMAAAKVLAIVHGDIFSKDAARKTALELALAKGDEWYGVMINQQTGSLRDENGESIVHYFVKTRDEKAIDRCIAIKLELSVKDKDGKTPLALALEHADDDVCARIAAKLILGGSELVRGDYSYFEDAVKTHNMILRFDDGQTPLHLATIMGHTGIVNYILSDRSVRIADILSAQDIGGATPLHEAIRYGRSDIASALLAAGANVNALDSIGKTPFLLIIPKESQYALYSTLLQYKASISQKDMYGDTVLHVATMSDASVEVLDLLVRSGALIDERNKQGVTPIELAIEYEHPEQVRYFANHGADIYAEDMNGASPLSKALKSSNIGILKTLVSKGNILSKDSAGNTALHIALMKNAPADYIKYLIDEGSDVNARNKSGDSVLLTAVQKNRKDAGDMLLEKGADIFATNTQNISPLRIALTKGGKLQDWLINSKTLNTTDGAGNTPLHYAAEWQLNDSITALIQRGAKVTAQNANGETPLFSAVKGNNPETIKILVRNGLVTDSSDNHARDNLGNTPLHAAVKWNAMKAAQTLISLGVDVNAQNLSGKTALSDACRSGKQEMALLLLKNKADINATDATGRTVLMDAIAGMNEQMVSLLLSKGANPKIQEMYGRNAYHEAASTGNVNIITMLRKTGCNPLIRDANGESAFSIVARADIKIIRAVLGDDLTLVDSDGNTPIHIGVEKNIGKNQLKQLLAAGYPASQRNGKGMTALNLAVEKNAKTAALILLEYGADPFLATNNGENALTSVFKTKNTEILDAIVKYNRTKSDRQGDGILHYAARTADKDTVRHLMSLKLDPEIKNITGETPADMAMRWGRAEIAELLKKDIKTNH